MSGAVGGAGQLLFDDFNSNGPIDGTRWKPNVGPGSYVNDTTQMRPELPVAQGGVLKLQFDTYNSGQGGPGHGGNASFFGSEAISQQTFALGGGVAYEARARMPDLTDGLIGGIFSYGLDDATRRRDELDWEIIPKRGHDKPQTNMFLDEIPGVPGPDRVQLHDGYDMSQFHTYRIEWLPNAVRWLIDGEVVRVEKGQLPTKDMAMHLNIWGAGSGWDTGSHDLYPVGSPSQNRTFFMEVDYAKVENLSTAFGKRGADKLSGSETNDYMFGGGGNDIMRGGQGNDTILGGNENEPAPAVAVRDSFGDERDYAERLYGGNGDDVIAGGRGDELLVGGRGEDTINGGPGDDAIIGGFGADRLLGGEGADLFVYRSVRDALPQDRLERIVDFNPRWGDKLDLSGIDADTGTAGDQAFAFIGDAAFNGQAGELRFERLDHGIRVEADVDGDGAADMALLIARVSLITEDDLVL